MKMRHAHLVVCGSLLLALSAHGADQQAMETSFSSPHDMTISDAEAIDFVKTFGVGLINDIDKGIGLGSGSQLVNGEGVDVSEIIRLMNPEEKSLTGLGCKPTITGSDVDADADGIKDNLEKSFDCDLTIAGYGLKANGKAMSLDKDTADPFGGFAMSVAPFAFEVAFPKDGVKKGYAGDFMAARDVTRADTRYEGKDRLSVNLSQLINDQQTLGGSFSRNMDTVWDNVQNGDVTGATLTTINGQLSASITTRPTGPVNYSLAIAGANLLKGGCRVGFQTGDISFTDAKGNVLKATFAEDCKGDWTFNGRKLPIPYEAAE